jgi:hypothetical protein
MDLIQREDVEEHNSKVHGSICILKGNVQETGNEVEVGLHFGDLSIPLIMGLLLVFGKDDSLS